MNAEKGVFFATLVGPIAKTFAARPPLEGGLVVDDELMVTAMMLPRKGLPCP
jgi:hypothetical protein